jgi:uncharacterized membrane protein
MAGLFKVALIAFAIAAYAAASHFALILPNGRAIAAALALGAPAIAISVFLFQWLAGRLATFAFLKTSGAARSATAAALAVLPIFGFLSLVWPMVLVNAEMLYFAQHIGTNALLGWVFGHTLVAGATPLVVTFARMVHPALPAEIEAYARRVTVAWTLFFVVTCVVSTILFFAAPLAAWSTFAVLLQWPSVAAFFVSEYLLRRLLFRHFEHASLKQGFDAYSRHQTRVQPAASGKP